MNFVIVGNTAVNVDQIVQINRINANSYTVFLSDGRTVPGITFAAIKPILDITGLSTSPL